MSLCASFHSRGQVSLSGVARPLLVPVEEWRRVVSVSDAVSVEVFPSFLGPTVSAETSIMTVEHTFCVGASSGAVTCCPDCTVLSRMG